MVKVSISWPSSSVLATSISMATAPAVALAGTLMVPVRLVGSAGSAVPPTPVMVKSPSSPSPPASMPGPLTV